MRFTLLRIVCTTQFWCFFTAQNVQKIKRPGVHFYMHIYMNVRVFVTECTITTAKQSVCLNYIKQSRDQAADSDKNCYHVGVIKCLWGRQQIFHPYSYN